MTLGMCFRDLAGLLEEVAAELGAQGEKQASLQGAGRAQESHVGGMRKGAKSLGYLWEIGSRTPRGREGAGAPRRAGKLPEGGEAGEPLSKAVWKMMEDRTLGFPMNAEGQFGGVPSRPDVIVAVKMEMGVGL